MLLDAYIVSLSWCPIVPDAEPLSEEQPSATRISPIGIEDAYLDLLKECLIGGIYRSPQSRIRNLRWRFYQPLRGLLHHYGLDLVKQVEPDAQAGGADYSSDALTMIGRRRLDNLQFCIRDVMGHDVPGDLIETGVWRGGAVIFMRAALWAYGDPQRRVWVADSFQGVPRPDGRKYPVDSRSKLWTMRGLAVPIEDVRNNFARYGLLDDRVHFIPGWFSDTLPLAPIERLAIIRLDGDLYESTMDALYALYDRLSPGGYAIIDDYGVMAGCRDAVDDFRRSNGITEELRAIDSSATFWQRRT